MRKMFLLGLSIILNYSLYAQTAYEKTIIEFQETLNTEYKDPEESPLTKKARRKFKGLDFFSIDQKYQVKAHFERVENALPFKMKTTTDRLPTYEVYGIATFTIDNKEYTLNVYQSHRLREMEKYKDHLFLPFADETNGMSSYGGGRFIDINIPEGNVLIIDFNKAYNPYCAYNDKYSCPKVPKENYLKVTIEAGVKH